MRRLLTDPSRDGEWVLIILLAIVSLTIAALAPSAQSDPLPAEAAESSVEVPVDPAVQEVTDHIRNFLTWRCSRGTPSRQAVCRRWAMRDRRWDRAPDLAVIIVEVARERDIDHLLVSVVARHEASFWEKERLKEGDAGEQGLMQVHGEVLRKALAAGYDLSTSRGQLEAGSDYLAECLQTCSNIQRALAKYQTGSCRSKHGGPKLRFKRYKRLLAKRAKP